MNVIKRNGKEVIFDKTKIINAVTKANEDEQNNSRVKLSTDQIKDIADHIENYCDTNLNRAISVEEIQDMVEDQIISKGFYNIAKCYIKYRYKRTLARQANTTDGVILSLVEQDNEEVKQENSNKNPTIISTQRDYVAGEVSRDITNRLLLPDDVVEAHKEGIIHFHDADYFIQKSFNCCLVNLEDMLQNGTVISGTLIEKPHSFSTACNIATQIIAQVASNQYGGQSVSLSHLAPFVDISRQKYIEQVRKEFEDNNIEYTEDMINNIAESRLLTEIKQGVQMIQYQVLTLMTTNGQTPFITIFMYIDEVPEGKLRDDLALIIRETISLRLKGIKNEQGAYISPAFPKLIYVLEEDNIYEDSKYWDITVLAAKCTAKRLVPDYISEKIMKQLKVDANGEGHCYPVMGCVLGSSVINCKIKNKLYKDITFEEFWNIISKMNLEINKFGLSEYYDTSGVVKIYDSYSNKYVVCKKLIKNPNLDNWLELNFDNGTRLVCTEDHPLPKLVKSHSKTIRTKAVNFKIGDSIPVSSLNKTSENTTSLISISKVSINECSYDVETESDHFDVNGINSHNCRSALTPYIDENGKPKYYGRFNCGVVTINLPDVALSSGGDMDKFWKIFDERLELCYKALMCRHNRLKGTKSDVSPIHWQYGAIARLKKGETIDKLLYNGYSTLSLGYAGLCECVRYMTGKSHTDEEVGKPFAIKVMQHLNDACAKWREETTIAFSLYGTPIESTTYKFAKCLQKRFGIIEGVTSKNYITNSYHVHVTEPIDAFSKLKFEAEFQALSPGGAISYVEVPNMQDNIPAVLSVMKYIYDNIMYAELNTKSDYCQVCAYDGEIQIVEDENKKLIWKCPKCGNTDQSKMNVARRVCGYISTNFFNAGRCQEIKERVLHL